MNKTKIITATKQRVIANIDSIIAIENSVKLPIVWTEENILFDIAAKWDLSQLLFHSDELMGYAFVSQKTDDTCHIHRFMIDPTMHQHGLGALMLAHVQELVFKDRQRLTLFVGEENVSAVNFYKKHDFQAIDKNGTDCLMLKQNIKY